MSDSEGGSYRPQDNLTENSNEDPGPSLLNLTAREAIDLFYR